MVERFHVGQRVRPKKTLATEPPGPFRGGATGTVTKMGGAGEMEAIKGEIAIWVRMDRHFPHLARWDNPLLVICSDVTDEARDLWARPSTARRGD
jgi:hypothetical protein